MKDEVLSIVKSTLSGAKDNLYRASMQFGKMSEKELNNQYGNSGMTCGEIFSQHQDEVSKLERCVTWVKSAE